MVFGSKCQYLFAPIFREEYGFEVTWLVPWPCFLYCFLYCFLLACCFHSVCEVIGSDSVQQQVCVCVEGRALFKWLGHLLPKLKQECIKHVMTGLCELP